MGRMGQQIIKSVKKNKDFKIVALTENKKIVKMINGIKVSLNTEKAFKKAKSFWKNQMKKKIKYTIFGIIYVLAILILGAYFYKEGIGII